jgi:DNA-binding transcriptional regulator YiaG
MPDKTIQLARRQLRLDNRDLARQLGVTEGCLRSWDRKGAPQYAKLALLALMAGLVPETDESVAVLAPRPIATHAAAE